MLAKKRGHRIFVVALYLGYGVFKNVSYDILNIRV